MAENQERFRVLIAGGSREYILPIRKQLEQTGLFDKVSVAFSGIEAYEKMTTEKQDLLITDIILRDMDGLSLLEKIRSDDIHCKIIVCTLADSEFIIRKSFAYGADFFLVKPFCEEKLRDIITELLGTWEQPYCSYEERMELMALGLIQRIGLPPGSMGYRYAYSALKRVLEDNAVLNHMTTELYPAIATEFDSTPVRVERNIRHAIEVAWSKGDLGYIEELFGYTVDEEKGKPTTTAFLATVADYIKRSLYCVESGF